MSSKLCVVFDFLELLILESQPICRSRFRFCTLLTNSELSQLERMLITLRLSGLSRVVEWRFLVLPLQLLPSSA